jgi:hypothetical protein
MKSWNVVLGLIGPAVVVACSGEDADSSGSPGGESDADTDADSDTDTDTDTDPSGWSADAIRVDADFGYDQATGTIRTMTWAGYPQVNAITAVLFNVADYTASSISTQFCYLTWTLPEGAIATNGDFASEYWLSFDLTDADVSYGGTDANGNDADCEHMTSFLGVPRGSTDLLTFAEGLGMGFGLEGLQDVDPTTLEDWQTNTWPASWSSVFGGWNQNLPSFAAGSITLQGSAPQEVDIMLGLETDPKTWTVNWDEATNTSQSVAMTGLTAAPTAYYVGIMMYAIGE